MTGNSQNKTKNIIHLIKTSNSVADAFWQLAQFWDLFVKDTLGKPLILACDRLSLYLAKAERQKGELREKQLQKAADQLLDVYILLDKAKRRKIINKVNYDLIYKYLEDISQGLN